MYQYKLRPVYGGSNLLLEFSIDSEQDTFMSDLFKAFKGLNLRTKSVTDLWMNDEVVIELSSDVGDFSLSKDIWGFVFIMADSNRDGIKILDEYLIKSGNFEKLDVDLICTKNNSYLQTFISISYFSLTLPFCAF